MSASLTNETTTYDQSGPGGAIPGNIIQTVAANEGGSAINIVTSPLTSAAVNPNVAPTGVSNQPLNAKTVPVGNLQITANGTSYLASWSNPA